MFKDQMTPPIPSDRRRLSDYKWSEDGIELDMIRLILPPRESAIDYVKDQIEAYQTWRGKQPKALIMNLDATLYGIPLRSKAEVEEEKKEREAGENRYWNKEWKEQKLREQEKKLWKEYDKHLNAIHDLYALRAMSDLCSTKEPPHYY